MADNYRIPRGFAVRHPQYQEIMEGQRPTIKDLVAAPYLPVAEIEPRTDDPIVIPAGTWVGIVGGQDVLTNEVDYDSGSLTTTQRYMVPACANFYHLTYTSNDISDTFGTLGNVQDIDDWTALARTGGTVTAAGASTAYIGRTGAGIKPLGIVYQDIYASWLGTQFVNYDRQPSIALLTRDYIIQTPIVTDEEFNIEPGDQVMVDGHGIADLSWAPSPATSNTGDMRVGHLIRVEEVADALTTGVADIRFAAKIQDYVVGRCMRKILVATYGTATEGSLLSSNISNLTRSTITSEYTEAGRVQTVPGLSLQGSGLKGVPGYARNATADADGSFWILEIHVGAC